MYFHIRSTKFPILPGEDAELVNERMYGKALSVYLQEKLKNKGYNAAFICCEDWGWWVEIAGAPITLGVCIYAGDVSDGLINYVVTNGATKSRYWSWKQFKFVDASEWIRKLNEDLKAIFHNDPEVEVVQITDDFPF